MAKTTKYILLIISILIYTFINNFLDRSEFTFLIFGIIIVGFIYFYFLKNNNFTVREIIISAVLFRVVLLFSTPNFSDDYFRFIWDGQILTQSENPYLFLPKEELNNSLITELKIDKEIYKGLNSKNYYTVYPPLNQFVFGGSSYFSGSNFSLNILFLKLFILLFEIATLFILFKFLRMLKLKQNLAIIYAFNPLVVIELVGNVHFEGMMLFLLLFSFYYLYKNKVILASILFGLAVSTKLIPLILLPLLLRYIGLKKSVIFYLIVGFVNIILMLPFLSHTFINNFSS